MGPLAELQAQQVAVFETFVVPRYLSMLGELALEMLIPCEGAVIANVGCRTGYPDQLLGQAFPGAMIMGFDPSQAALELARTKAALLHSGVFEYRQAPDLPLPVANGSFSHALALYPLLEPARRPELLQELARLVAPGGQVLLALPLRGSYQELTDLLREYALKNDSSEVAKALEEHLLTRPSMETLSELFESCGLDDVDVSRRSVSLSFSSGRDFFEDPVARHLILPDMELALGLSELTGPMRYVREAIDRYWSEGDFELSINLGCASARRWH